MHSGTSLGTNTHIVHSPFHCPRCQHESITPTPTPSPRQGQEQGEAQESEQDRPQSPLRYERLYDDHPDLPEGLKGAGLTILQCSNPMCAHEWEVVTHRNTLNALRHWQGQMPRTPFS